MPTLIATNAPIDTDHIDFSDLGMGGGWTATPVRYSLYSYGGTFELSGAGFTYFLAAKIGVGAAPTLTGGIVTGLRGPDFTIEGISIPATTVSAWVGAYPDYAFNLAAFSGADSFTGSSGNDVLRGDAGDDTIEGGGGDDILDGGTASRPASSGVAPDPSNDGANYLRGGDGNDSISGGAGSDDINGNSGDDRALGGPGADWVVGGKDNDELYGDSTPWDYDSEGPDIVLGNLGDDTLDGGGEADLVRGGQGDDVLYGRAGADWLSGDRGSDTMTGGTGADIFHSFAEAGLDRITDFNAAEGDRVQLDPGSTYAAAQSGADTVISIGGGAQVVLIGVQISSLTGAWIFVG